MEQKKLVASILNFLQSSLPSMSQDDAESLQVSIDCIRGAFSVNESDASLQTTATLEEIFNNHLQQQTPQSNTSTTSTTTATPTSPASVDALINKTIGEVPEELREMFASYFNILKTKGAFVDPSKAETVVMSAKLKFFEIKSVEIKAAAEKLKVEGNSKLSGHDYNGAVECYTKAIQYDPTNAIYFANRSSAFSNLKQYEKAVEDANTAIERNPSYGKAYFRLGSANMSLGKIQEAVDAYKKAIELEPNNEVYKSSLANAESKVNSPTSGGGMPNIPGMPDLGGLDLGSLLNNPMLRNMAQNFMQDPQMRQMMENQNFQDIARNVLNNPDQMANMFGGLMGKNVIIDGVEEF
ncbi:tetratricopeptide-like helical domain-containing protein [Heterostelium album PN500]|uniref:Tetratricopeptide-like helical domain-containing protein n=1 Tax=Heterostelium pallidum (strain ATCC 26659 / Pp 5 / PN500) TaxID=670386 RepID=D3BQ40_HETP5|nr:tetratricopeptide-like helical domain-containing protein [Heterostelium album PN500]EFA76591.1 tetratricopeptide-like helical domain-containing protein [Heterostelium album PN500]|eukprot:XP_020428723.1 tetratricopeptide-like helical domain-containing protein [Heterostelium album PN500]